MDKEKTQLYETDTVKEENGKALLILLHTMFSHWAIDSIESYKKLHPNSENSQIPQIISFSTTIDKNAPADGNTFYNIIDLLNAKYFTDNECDATTGDLYTFIAENIYTYLLRTRSKCSSEISHTLLLEDLADGVIYYPYLPRVKGTANTSYSENALSAKTTYGRYTAEIMTALTGVFYTTLEDQFKGKIIECDAALITLLAPYIKKPKRFLENNNNYTKSEKKAIINLNKNLRLKNISNMNLLSYYYNNPELIIEQLLFTVRRLWSKEIPINKSPEQLSLFSYVEKYSELINAITDNANSVSSTDKQNKYYPMFADKNPDMLNKYCKITAINIAIYQIYKYLHILIMPENFSSVNAYTRNNSYNTCIHKIIAQFLLIIYVEKKGFEGIDIYNKLTNSPPYELCHPFIALGNNYKGNHPQNYNSRIKFYDHTRDYDIMDSILEKYDTICYQTAMKTFQKGVDASYINSEAYINEAENIAKTITKDYKFDKEKYRLFIKLYFRKFNNIFFISNFLNENVLNKKDQKPENNIQNALDSQDKAEVRKALWNLIGLYGHYMNNNCRYCNHYSKIRACELNSDKNRIQNKDAKDIREWEYNIDGCNCGCNIGKKLAEIEDALYDLYSMFNFPNKNDSLSRK